MFCHFAQQKILPESKTQPKITPRVAIMHSAAGRGSLYNFFRNSSNLESHFWISEDGLIEQYVDTNRRADANLNANGYAISIETESSVQATERWSWPQATALVRLLDWICTVHDIPRTQVLSPAGEGLGWHIMFGAPGPWTPVAKSCPGPARVVQAKTEIIPAVAALAAAPEPPKGPLMALTDKEQTELLDKVRDLHTDYAVKGKGVRQTIAEIAQRTSDLVSGKRPGKG